MPPFGLVIHDNAAPQRFTGRGPSQDVPVAAYSHEGLAQFELDPALFARIELFRSEQAQGGNRLARADEEFHLAVVLERGRDVLEQTKVRVDSTRRLILIRVDQHFAAPDGFGIDARNVDCGPRAWHGAFLFFLVRLQSAHAPLLPRREDLHFVAKRQLAVEQRPCDDGAESAHAEDAVDGQARTVQIQTDRFVLKDGFESRE
jgi:hypothetical protein